MSDSILKNPQNLKNHLNLMYLRFHLFLMNQKFLKYH